MRPINSTHALSTLLSTIESFFKSQSRRRVMLACLALVALGVSAIALFTPSSSALTNNGSITTLGSPLTENFDTLASTGTGLTWTDNSTIAGWYSTRTAYNSATGNSATGALYSFGVAGTNPVTDRALGGVASGTTGTFYWAARFVNNTGNTITSLDISYVGEQWRNGGSSSATPGVAQTIQSISNTRWRTPVLSLAPTHLPPVGSTTIILILRVQFLTQSLLSLLTGTQQQIGQHYLPRSR
jgi:hypothetical protein